MPDHSAKSIAIVVNKSDASLSNGQKTFNRLIKHIEQKRQQLAAWDAVAANYQHKYTAEMLPQQRRFLDLSAKMVLRLDRAHREMRLTGSERRKLSQVIIHLLAKLPDLRDDAELKSIYNLHSGSDYEVDLHSDLQTTRAMVEEMMGVELDDDFDFSSPEEVMQQASAKLRDIREQEAAAREARQSKRKKTAKQLARVVAQEAEEKDISDAIREVFRKLASALHPDREQDPVERERKNQLMQKANKAYASRNLLQLLELQLELEHIDPAALAQLSDDRLKRYNGILKDQLAELDMELVHVENRFIMRFQVEANPFQPLNSHTVLRQLDIEVKNKRHTVAAMEHDLASFDDINAVKAFLRSLKRLAR
jgi:hypothetical protein